MNRRTLLAGLAAGLPAARDAAAQERPAPRPAASLPALPPPAPPPPPQLTPEAAAPTALGPLPGGLETLPEGAGWRVLFAGEGRTVEDPAVLAALRLIAQRLAAEPRGRVTLVAQAGAPANDVSLARRLSLVRALEVKNALTGGGLDETRIDVRPLGRTPAGLDAVDIVPPDAPRPPAR